MAVDQWKADFTWDLVSAFVFIVGKCISLLIFGSREIDCKCNLIL
jgi:hypothetical protein